MARYDPYQPAISVMVSVARPAPVWVADDRQVKPKCILKQTKILILGSG